MALWLWAGWGGGLCDPQVAWPRLPTGAAIEMPKLGGLPLTRVVFSRQREAERTLPEHLGLPGHHQEQPGQSPGPEVGVSDMPSCGGGPGPGLVEGEPQPSQEAFLGDIFYKRHVFPVLRFPWRW